MKPTRALPDNWADSFRARFVERLAQVLARIGAWTIDSGDEALEDLQTAPHTLVGNAAARGNAQHPDAVAHVDPAIRRQSLAGS